MANSAFSGGGTATAASQAQMEAASSEVVYSTPGRQQYHPASIKAFCRYDQSGSPVLYTTYNVTSCTDNATGDYTVNFTTSLSSANYVGCECGGRGTTDFVVTVAPFNAAPTAGALRCGTFIGSTSSAVDNAIAGTIVYGDM